MWKMIQYLKSLLAGVLPTVNKKNQCNMLIKPKNKMRFLKQFLQLAYTVNYKNIMVTIIMMYVTNVLAVCSLNNKN